MLPLSYYVWTSLSNSDLYRDTDLCPAGLLLKDPFIRCCVPHILRSVFFVSADATHQNCLKCPWPLSLLCKELWEWFASFTQSLQSQHQKTPRPGASCSLRPFLVAAWPLLGGEHPAPAPV